MKEKMEGRLKILIVSGSKKKRDHYRSFFHKMGIFVESCESYDQAVGVCYLNLKRFTPVNGALIEYSLDMKDGISLAEELKEMDENLTLMLLPSKKLTSNSVKKRYIHFGGFDLFPDDSPEGIEAFLAIALKKEKAG